MRRKHYSNKQRRERGRFKMEAKAEMERVIKAPLGYKSDVMFCQMNP